MQAIEECFQSRRSKKLRDVLGLLRCALASWTAALAAVVLTCFRDQEGQEEKIETMPLPPRTQLQNKMQDKNKDTSGLSARLPMQPHGTCDPELPNHLIF